MTAALVILGSTITALAVARDARAHGLLPIIVDTRRGIACDTSGAQVELLDASQSGMAELARVCALGRSGRHFLIATGDIWLRFVIAHRDALEQAFARVLHADNEMLSTCLNKVRFAQWCRRHGVPAPRAWLPGREARPAELSLPVLLRPAETLHNRTPTKIPKAVQIESEPALSKWLERYAEADVEPLVTESLLDQPLIQYSVPVARANGQALSFVAKKLRPAPEACAVGTYVELSPEPQVEAQVLRALEALDYYGIAEVEVLHAPETGRSVVIEVNARPWLQYALAPASGHDFLGLLLDTAPLRLDGLRKTGVTWLNLHDDLYVCWSRSLGMVRHGQLDVFSYLKSLWRANVYAVFDAGDPGPWWTGLRRRATRTPAVPSTEETAGSVRFTQMTTKPPHANAAFDTSSRPEFVSYYAAQSVTSETFARFGHIRDKVTRLWERHNNNSAVALSIMDIGCGAGTSSQLWAERGHRVSGLDVNASLIELARRRCREAGLDIRLDVGTATSLPYPDASFDVCLLPELLEHVPEWQQCLEEAVRVLKPGAVLYLSTTNVLCPKQQEFNLPFYSWYPAPLKHRYERLALTTRPELASFARYPAVNWFNFYGVRAWFRARGMLCLDRFDLIDRDQLRPPASLALGVVRSLPPARFLAHVTTPYLAVFVLKPIRSGSAPT